jgi:hypothetical protein
VALVLVADAGCGGTTPPRRAHPPAVPRSAAPLEVGLTELNPHLYAPGPQPRPFAQRRDQVLALAPRVLRIPISWNHVQPRPDAAPDWAMPQDGCDRGIPPCAPYAGVREELLAAKASGMQVMVTFLGVPDWAAAPPSGCERPNTTPAQRGPGDLGAYRALVRSLAAEARRDGVDIRWWSAWNESNHPAFLNPQRASCDASSASLAPARYAQLVRVMRSELARAPGDHRIVIGELSGLARSSPYVTGVGQFVRALPRDVACSAGVLGQHIYVERRGELSGNSEKQPPGSEPVLRDVEAGLAAHGCPGPPPPVWITETGVDPATGPAGCRDMAQALRVWSRDGRVSAAFQYTFRDDPVFRSGLTDPGMTVLHPAYGAWRAAATGNPGGGC